MLQEFEGIQHKVRGHWRLVRS